MKLCKQETVVCSDCKSLIVFSVILAIVGLVIAYLSVAGVNNYFTLKIFYFKFITQDTIALYLSFFSILFSWVMSSLKLNTDTIFLYLYNKRSFIACIVFGVTSIGTFVVYHNLPLTMDEFCPYFQSQIFSKGQLSATITPPELVNLVIPAGNMFFKASLKTGEVISGYWPGFAAMLTPFMYFGVPWMLNPFLSGCSILLLAYISNVLFDEKKLCGLVVLLTIASPVFIINGMSFYSMTAHMFLNLAFTALLLKPKPLRLFCAGMLGSLALLLSNPFPHAVYAGVWFVWLLFQKDKTKNILWLLAGYLPIVIIGGMGWSLFEESILQANTSNSYVNKGFLYTVRDAFSRPSLKILLFRIMGVIKVHAWAVPGLLFLALIGMKRTCKDSRFVAISFSLLVMFSVYFFVGYSQGHGWGYRYIHPAWGGLPLLAAAAVSKSNTRQRLEKFLLWLIFCSLVCNNALRMFQVDSFITRHLAQRPPIVQGREQISWIRFKEGYYAMDLVQNTPFLTNNPLYFVSPGRSFEKKFMAKFFPNAVSYENDPETGVWLFPSEQHQNAAEK